MKTAIVNDLDQGFHLLRETPYLNSCKEVIIRVTQMITKCLSFK